MHQARLLQLQAALIAVLFCLAAPAALRGRHRLKAEPRTHTP